MRAKEKGNIIRGGTGTHSYNEIWAFMGERGSESSEQFLYSRKKNK